MAYNVNNLARLSQLKALAQKLKTERDALSNRIDDIVTAGGEPNVINSIKVNGTALAIADKMVDILISTGSVNGSISVNGTDVSVKGLAALAYKANISESDLSAALKAVIDAKASDVDVTALQTAVSTLNGTGIGSVKKTVDDAINDFATKVSDDGIVNTIKELVDWVSEHGAEAAEIAGDIKSLEDLIGTLPEGATSVAGELAKKVDKVAGSRLMTDAEGTKLSDLENYTHPTHTAKASGLYKVTIDSQGHVSATATVAKADITALGIPEQDTTYSPATASANGLMTKEDKAKLDGITVATDEEVAEMLQEVFGDEPNS